MWVTLTSYGAAKREVLPSVEHRQSRYLNNRPENAHQPTRKRERVMQRFKSASHAQRFLAAFGPIRDPFCPRRHRLNAADYRRLWYGDVPGALAALEEHRRETKNEAKLDDLISYLQARAAWIPNYRQRRLEQQYIGSGHAEKANDLIVARQQRNRGMQWSRETSDTLAALRTLLLNGGWERSWQQRKVFPLLVS